jgi:hypothetical protein
MSPPAGPPFFAETPNTPILALPEEEEEEEEEDVVVVGGGAGEFGIESLSSLSESPPLLDRIPVARETADFRKRHGVFGLLSPLDAECGGEGGGSVS